MTWVFGRRVLSYLSWDENKRANHPDKLDDSARHLLDAYEMGLRRGLAPRDALTVATALENASRSAFPRADAAEHCSRPRSKH
jgi:hypothetical protein